MSKSVKVAILTIGDEILYGQTLDTNSHWMSDQLDSYGFKLIYKATVGDNEPDIINGLKNAEDRADIILITGGLGPTADDLTKPCLAKYFDVPLRSDPGALVELTSLFKSINRDLSQSNIDQTNLPANSDYLSNSIGTAPGMWIEEKGKVFISMPGVPAEMKAMMVDLVLPKLRDKYELPIVVHRIIKTIGIGESWLSEKIESWEKTLPENIGLAYLPTLGQVKLRLTSVGDDREQLNKMMDQEVARLLPYAEKYIYAYGETKIEELIGDLLMEKKKSLGTAESCTGGFLAHLITSVPGSSDYFKGSIIAYSNEIKVTNLGVQLNTLERHGAVSEETIVEMAKGAKDQLNVDYAIATSGIAGPGGGTDEKPVGTIWIAVAYKDKVKTKQLRLFKDRVFNIKMTALYSLGMLWRILIK